MKEALLAYLGQEVGGQRAATAAANYWQIENVYVNMPADSEGGAGMMQSLLTILAKNAKNVLKGSGA
jgi:glycyl-tRNA synthetase alpha subunit